MHLKIFTLSLNKIKVAVPQDRVLGPVLYLLYTSDVPQTANTKTATFADDTAVMAVVENIKEATDKLQQAINAVSSWAKLWRIILNEIKAVHVNFTNRKVDYMQVTINSNQIPPSNMAKYLGMTLDAKLRWKEHVKKKIEELNIKYREVKWLLGRTSQLSIQNKILVYSQVMKPVWTYGIQLWGCASKSNIQRIQKYQNKVLRGIVNAPWYACDSDIDTDFGIRMVTAEIKRTAKKHEDRLHHHTNVEATQLLDEKIVRRLMRLKPFELA
jgi:hypothetical protein